MKIVGLLGSTRRGGNTEILLDLALEEAHRNGTAVSKVVLREKTIAPCDGCMGCAQDGRCVIHDDMEDVYRAMLEADGILWATPVYFWSMTGLTKTVMDRTYALGFPTLQLSSKVGGLIVTAGSRGCMNTANVFHMYFAYNHMLFAEFASGYAGGKGEITKNLQAIGATKEMVHQMIALIRSNFKYPGGFDVPMPRLVRKKYEL